jgi:hypothetical protein
VLEISPEVSSEEERTFIILTLLYSETKRRERSTAALLPEVLQSFGGGRRIGRYLLDMS